MRMQKILADDRRGGSWVDVGRGRSRRPFVTNTHDACKWQRRATQASPPIHIIRPRPYSPVSVFLHSTA